jgi:hypothetical protein
MGDCASVPRNSGGLFEKGDGIVVGVKEQDLGLHLTAELAEPRNHLCSRTSDSESLQNCVRDKRGGRLETMCVDPFLQLGNVIVVEAQCRAISRWHIDDHVGKVRADLVDHRLGPRRGWVPGDRGGLVAGTDADGAQISD